MLNIGPGELLAICVLALIVLGPEKLPQAIRTAGRVTGELRRMSNGFQSELQNALREEQPEPRRVTPERPAPPPAPVTTVEDTGTDDPAGTIAEDAPDKPDRS